MLTRRSGCCELREAWNVAACIYGDPFIRLKPWLLHGLCRLGGGKVRNEVSSYCALFRESTLETVKRERNLLERIPLPRTALFYLNPSFLVWASLGSSLGFDRVNHAHGVNTTTLPTRIPFVTLLFSGNI